MTIPPREVLLRAIAEKAFRWTPEPSFRLASGAMSNFYIDCKLAVSYAAARAAIGALVLERLGPEGLAGIDAVGGPELGAVPVAVAVSDAAWGAGRDVPAFIVRKEPKGHGTRQNVEGAVKEGDRVLVVEDVVTTGDSAVKAIRKCREAGLAPVRAIALVDRRDDPSVPVDADGLPLEALLTLADVVKEKSRLLGREIELKVVK